MKHYAIINGTQLLLIIAENENEARNWVRDHVEKVGPIVVREIETFEDVTSGISNR